MDGFDEFHGLRDGIARLEDEIEGLGRTLRLTRASCVGSYAVSRIEKEIHRYESALKGMLGELHLQEPTLWLGLQREFQFLAAEERAILRQAGKHDALRASCEYKEHPEVWETGKPQRGLLCLLKTPECGVWILYKGPNENFRARFEALAARAAVVLGLPKDTDALDYWLHRLFLDLRENNSHELLAVSEEGGMIRHACEASATFCCRLERKAVEVQRLVPIPDTKRRKPGRCDPEIAKRTALVRSNPNISADEMCETLDRERVPLPRKWQEAGFPTWRRTYRDANYRSRIDTLISKARTRN